MNDNDLEKLYEEECYVIDFLPKQVTTLNGQYFEVEDYYLNQRSDQRYHNKGLHVILKLMCYYDMMLCWKDKWYENVEPQFVVDTFNEMMQCNEQLLGYFPEDNTLIVWERQQMNIGVYNPSDDIKNIVSSLALSEGLFFWKSPNC